MTHKFLSFSTIVYTFWIINNFLDIDFDLTPYTVERAIAGIFSLVGQKEMELRENPSGSASAKVMSVFSRASEL